MKALSENQTATARVRIGPARGIVFAHTAKGRQLSTTDIERWLRLNRTVFKCDKVDVIADNVDWHPFAELATRARSLDLHLSLRTNCASAPPPDAIPREHLGDVMLCPPDAGAPHFERWLRRCREADVPLRVQLNAPFERELDVAALAGLLAGVKAVNIAAVDPFVQTAPARNSLHSAVSVQKAVELARAIAEHGIEVNLIRFPFCSIPYVLWPNVVNSAQFFLDHQQYNRESFEWAAALFHRSAPRVRLAILMRLGQHTSTNNPIDRILLPWIMDHPWARARVWALHKLTRHRKSALPASPALAGLEVEKRREANRRARGPVCSECRFVRICGGTGQTEKTLPGLAIVSIAGDTIVDPLAFSRAQLKYYDTLDTARRDAAAISGELARRANSIVANNPPFREIDSFDYSVEGTWSWQLPGSLRWFSFAGGEKVSTPLGRFDPPFTLSVTFGGGVADYIGYAIGRSCRLLCPMTAYTHRVVLHVEKDGQYVLVRDGQPVRPVEFAGAYYAPTRLGKAVEPRIAAWNIDGTIGTQAVYVWQETGERAESKPVDVSLVMVCTRYSRRLQACLHNLAHQRGIEQDRIEVVVAFVPGIDTTNDVLDSIRLAYPNLAIVPVPFAPEYANTKGLMLNECLDKVRGEWVVVLDADILLAPEFLARLTELPKERKFAIPDGRKMLSREATASVLLGNVVPSESWGNLIAGAGEYRKSEADGVPVGYCQCVRRECLEKVRYEELHHFEGADWKFGKDMRDAYGMEYRLEGLPVLHLDHGSSNWYGAARHW